CGAPRVMRHLRPWQYRNGVVQGDMMNEEQVHNLLYEALETEAGGMQVYSKALECVIHEDLKEEWEKYLEQTTTHHQTLLQAFEELGLDPEKETPGRKIVRHHGESLVKAMDMARQE